jgi:hypothetical protein
LDDFNEMIYSTINATASYDNSNNFSPIYSSSTGDGVVLCFTFPTDPFEFSLVLHSKLFRYNKIKSDKSFKIHIRTGISSGLTGLVKPFVMNSPSAPWGRNMVIAKRIMDLCGSDQILVDKSTVDQIGQFSRGYSFKGMGKYKVKHDDVVEVCAFTYQNKEISESMFGKKIRITIGSYNPINYDYGEKYSD